MNGNTYNSIKIQFVFCFGLLIRVCLWHVSSSWRREPKNYDQKQRDARYSTEEWSETTTTGLFLPGSGPISSLVYRLDTGRGILNGWREWNNCDWRTRPETETLATGGGALPANPLVGKDIFRKILRNLYTSGRFKDFSQQINWLSNRKTSKVGLKSPNRLFLEI